MPELKIRMWPSGEDSGGFEEKRREAENRYLETLDLYERYSRIVMQNNDVGARERIQRISRIREEAEKKYGEYLADIARIEAQEKRYFENENNRSAEEYESVYAKYADLISEDENLARGWKIRRLTGFKERVKEREVSSRAEEEYI